jgi:hypothetical protein
MVVENAAFNELMKIAGWSGKYDDEVTITGHDPVLPTYFCAGEMTAGIHAACGVAVSKLWELKTGRRHRCKGGCRHTAKFHVSEDRRKRIVTAATITDRNI